MHEEKPFGDTKQKYKVVERHFITLLKVLGVNVEYADSTQYYCDFIGEPK